MGGGIDRAPDQGPRLGPGRVIGDLQRRSRTFRQPHGAGILAERTVLPVAARLAVVAFGFDVRRLVDRGEVQARVRDRRQGGYGQLDDQRQEAQES